VDVVQSALELKFAMARPFELLPQFGQSVGH